MTAVLPTQTEVRDRYVPLRVENGRVAEGRFEGATATRDMRWDCLTLRCCVLDGWHVHEPRCDRDHARPAAVGPLPGPYEARQIEYQELVKSGHFDLFDGCRDSELARRQANTERGAW